MCVCICIPHVQTQPCLKQIIFGQPLVIPRIFHPRSWWRRHEIHGLCWLCGLKIHGAPLAPNKIHISMLKFVKIFISYISCQIKVIKDKMVQTCSKMVSPRPDTTGKMSIIPMNQLDPKPMKAEKPSKTTKSCHFNIKNHGLTQVYTQKIPQGAPKNIWLLGYNHGITMVIQRHKLATSSNYGD